MALLIRFFLDFLVKWEPEEGMSKAKRTGKRGDNVKLYKSENETKKQRWYNGLLIFLVSVIANDQIPFPNNNEKNTEEWNIMKSIRPVVVMQFIERILSSFLNL